MWAPARSGPRSPVLLADRRQQWGDGPRPDLDLGDLAVRVFGRELGLVKRARDLDPGTLLVALDEGQRGPADEAAVEEAVEDVFVFPATLVLPAVDREPEDRERGSLRGVAQLGVRGQVPHEHDDVARIHSVLLSGAAAAPAGP